MTNPDTINLAEIYPLTTRQMLSQADRLDSLATWFEEQWERNMHPQARGEKRKQMIRKCRADAAEIRKKAQYPPHITRREFQA